MRCTGSAHSSNWSKPADGYQGALIGHNSDRDNRDASALRALISKPGAMQVLSQMGLGPAAGCFAAPDGLLTGVAAEYGLPVLTGIVELYRGD